jgi:hypothetical protein
LYREYLETPLSSSLVAGETYQVSFYVSLSDKSYWAVDKIGAYLSNGPVGPVNTLIDLPSVVPSIATQVNNPPANFISNILAWTLVTGQYTAVGGENTLVIGNFFNDTLTTTQVAGGAGYTFFSYYYIDDVSVTIVSDLGDAPDSTNHTGSIMTSGYSPNNPVAHFPTVYDPSAPGPAGPLHHNAVGFAWLGQAVSFEEEADTGWDQDSFNNINYILGNQDLKDDGLNSVFLPECGTTQLKFSATNASQSTPVIAYINVWFDWTRDGDWDDIPRCAVDPVTTVIVPEWAVQNYFITLTPGFNPGLLTPLFRSINPSPGQPIWMRITLTDVAVNAANHGGPFVNPSDLGKGGSGPVGGYQFGETEDYLLGTEPTPVPGVAGWGILTLVLGLTGTFLLLLKRSRKTLSSHIPQHSKP